MTLTDKIAALPKMPTLAAMAEPNRVYLLTEVECLYAYNAMLSKARKHLDHNDSTDYLDLEIGVFLGPPMPGATDSATGVQK